MADLSALGTLKPVEPLDLENYVVNRKAKFQFPKRGTYTLQAPESFPAEAFTRTKSDKLGIEISPTIVGPTNEGFKVRYQRIYSSTWTDKKTGKTVSSIGNYLVANGVKGTFSDEQSLADAVESTAGRTYQAILDWKARKGQWELSGEENFPINPESGERQSYVLADGKDGRPLENDEEGNPKRIFANLEIVYFIPSAN